MMERMYVVTVPGNYCELKGWTVAAVNDQIFSLENRSTDVQILALTTSF